MIIKYVKDGSKTIGVLVGAKSKVNEFNIGYSAVKPKSKDVFDKKFGLDIAYKRAVINCDRVKSSSTLYFPEQLKEEYKKFYKRCEKYFKNHKPSEKVTAYNYLILRDNNNID